MMLKKMFPAAALAISASLSLMANPVLAEVDYTKMTPEELAEYLIFETNSFKLDQPVQEGGVAKQRMVQDELQKECTVLGGKQRDPAVLGKVSAMAYETIEYPEDGIQLGDWKRGRQLAWSGFGYRIGHKNDDHEAREVGGNCYNCHQIASDRTGGSLGPSLYGYGRARGTSDAMLTHTYNVLYNSHAAFPCTNMPRFGVKGYLSQQDIADIMAYLFDPESPVNQ